MQQISAAHFHYMLKLFHAELNDWLWTGDELKWLTWPLPKLVWPITAQFLCSHDFITCPFNQELLNLSATWLHPMPLWGGI